ncbi:MAG: hypothetical protein IJA08_05925 [Clostridia bacterium]|nr:hypothetical protein [Clostridia bacterium]
MKTLICCLTILGLLLSACSANEEKEPKVPMELSEIKDSFSSLYQIIFRKENESIFPTLGAEEAVMVGSGFEPFPKENVPTGVGFYDERKHYYIKEALKQMETARVRLLHDGAGQETIEALDNIVHRLAHEINEKNDAQAMEALNDGIYLISRLMDDYGKACEGCVLRLEYSLNLLEMEAENPKRFINALSFTQKVISELESKVDDDSKTYVKQMKESVISLQNASEYNDEELIRLKVEIMRANWKKISSMTKT